MHEITLAQSHLEELGISPRDLIWLVAISGGLLLAIISRIASSARATSVAREQEQSRREIAAYVAEGSMTPEQAEKLLAAGAKPEKSSCC